MRIGSAGVINGAVVDDGGRPIAGASVSYRKNLRMQPGSARNPLRAVPDPKDSYISGTTATDPAGSFASADLPSGSYTVCVEFPDGAYLDTCKWDTGSLATVSGVVGTKVVLRIPARRAGLVQVRVNDPKGLMPTVDQFVAAPKLVLGVMTQDGSFYGARILSKDAGGRTLWATVPLNTALKLWVFSRDFSLTLGDGTSVNNLGTTIPLQVTSAVDPVSYTFNITGMAPPTVTRPPF